MTTIIKHVNYLINNIIIVFVIAFEIHMSEWGE